MAGSKDVTVCKCVTVGVRYTYTYIHTYIHRLLGPATVCNRGCQIHIYIHTYMHGLLGPAAVGLMGGLYGLTSVAAMNLVWAPLVQRPTFGRRTAFLIAVPMQVCMYVYTFTCIRVCIDVYRCVCLFCMHVQL